MGNYRNHETNHYDMIHDLLEEPNLSKEAREFYEYFLKHPEETEKINKLLVNGKSIIAVSNIIADFIEEVSEVEAQSILQSIYKARTEEDFKTVFGHPTEDGAIHCRV